MPGVLACSGRIEKDELVAVSVAMERPDGEGGWFVGVTRGTTLSSEHAKLRGTPLSIFLNLHSLLSKRNFIFFNNFVFFFISFDFFYFLEPL